MSAFLGPIHEWMYQKIKGQESLVQAVLTLSESHGWKEGLRQEINQKYGELEQGSLEEIVDETNIHGWLSERVACVENRLAYAVTQLLCGHEERSKDILSVFYKDGQEKGASLPSESDCTQIYTEMTDSLLDGMPCDSAVEVQAESQDEVVWNYVGDIHEAYWKALGADADVFYRLRAEWVKGFLFQKPVLFEQLGNRTFRISRG
ncbi:hypothetical protein [Faecalispora anaeroviscerum]|uniref:hypothetical protein n=1 Tax=Faecalispora anaeroviscerum TaxID=2991836 RepID=UPI0024BA17F5|nr:hypothetical protein [Faecalispora anaeroviscerum]